MPDLTVGVGPGAGLIPEPDRPDNFLQLSSNLDVRVANALQQALDQRIQDRQADVAIDASKDADEVEVDDSAEVDNTSSSIGTEVKTDRLETVKTDTESLQSAQVIMNRGVEIVDQFRDDLIRRAADIELLDDKALVSFATALLSDNPLDVSCQAQQAALEQRAAEAIDALSRVAQAVQDRPWPEATQEIAEHIATEVRSMINPAELDPMAIDFLACQDVDSIGSLVKRADDPELDPATRQAATFDAHLAMAYAEHFLNEQVSEARAALQTDLQELPEMSRARKAAEAMLAIQDRIPDTDPASRTAVEAYYDARTESLGYNDARELLDRLLASDDDALASHIVTITRDATDDLGVDQALVERARPGRVSPFDGTPADPASADFQLLKTDLLEHVRSAILTLENPVDAIELHAQARLQTAFAVLELVDCLKQRDAIEPGADVVVGGAWFQLGKGSKLDETEAAHKLAGQIFIGVDAETLASLSEEQRQSYRLDTLLESDPELASFARVAAAATSVLPGYANKVDSLWENQGLRGAFQEAVATLVNRDASSVDAVAEAYEQFRASARQALEAAYKINAEKQLAQAQAETDTAAAAADLARRAEAIAVYNAVLAQTNAEQARMSVLEWLAAAQYDDDKRAQ